MATQQMGSNPITRRQALVRLGMAGVGLTAIGPLLEACQSSSSTPSPSGASSNVVTGSQSASSAAASASGKISFLTVDDEPAQTIHKDLIKMFEAANPGTTVELTVVPFEQLQTKIIASVAGGAPFDVYWSDGPQTKGLAYNGVVAPIEGWLYTKDEVSAFLDTSVQEGSYNGLLYAVPRRQSAEVVYYNVDVFDKAGIKPPSTLDTGWTFDKWREAWLAVNRPGMWGVVSRDLPFGAGTYESLAEIRSAGAKGSPTYQTMSPDGTTVKGYLDTPEAIAAMTFWQNLITTDKVTPAAAVPQAFQTGIAASLIAPEAFVGRLTKNFPAIHFSVSPMPYFKTGLSSTGSYMYTVSTKTPNRDLAGEFVKWISNEENSQYWFDQDQQTPARKSILQASPLYKTLPHKLFLDTIEQWGVPRPQTPANGEYEDLIIKMFTDVGAGAQVDSRVAQAVAAIDQVLAKYPPKA